MRSGKLALGLLGILLASEVDLPAQFVVSDPAALAQMLLAYQQQLQQVLNEVESIRLMTVESQHLLAHPATSLQSDLYNLTAILNGAQGLSYEMARMDQQFRTTYQPYAMSNQPYYTAYNQWATMTMNTVRGTLQGAGFQGNNILNNEQQFMSQIRALMSQPNGRNQTLELANAVGTEEIGQLEKLRQLFLLDLQSKAAYTGYLMTKDQTAANNSALALQHQDRGADQKSY